jgi:ribonuclease BN (tRNA processing enzyme)
MTEEKRMSEGPRRPHDPRRFVTTYQHAAQFSVVLIGTGCPEYNPRRSGPSALIQADGHYFLVDMGNGTQVRLLEAGIAFHDIETMMFTHHHLDHNEEYLPISVLAWLQGRRHANLVGPPKTKALHDFLLSFYREDLEYRARLTGSSLDGMFTNVEITELEGDNELEINGVRISTTEVPHTAYTLAYRFDSGDSSIVISGDLSYSDDLVQLARDADVLVMDSGGVIKKGGGPRRPPPVQMGQGFVRAHGTLQEVATMAAKANVKKMVLTHFTPGEIDVEASLREMSKIYSGEILFGEDLMEVTP